MISKETFVKTMQRLEKIDFQMNEVDEAFHALCSNFGGFYISEALEIPLSILREMFNDKETDWLGYLAFDRKFLNDWKGGYVRDENGNDVDLSTWDKVYDFLIENMEG